MPTAAISHNFIRTITTSIVHAPGGQLHSELETLLGDAVLSTSVVRILLALRPWALAHPQLQDESWWDSRFRPTDATIELELPTAEDLVAVRDRAYPQVVDA